MYNNDTTIVVSYLIYLLISVALTVWVARTLHKRGAIFLVDAFPRQCRTRGIREPSVGGGLLSDQYWICHAGPEEQCHGHKLAGGD